MIRVNKLRKVVLCTLLVVTALSMVACKKTDNTADEGENADDVIEVHITATPIPDDTSGKTLAEILGTAVSPTPTFDELISTEIPATPTLEPTAPTPEIITPTPEIITPTPDLSNIELADNLFNLLAKREEQTEEVTDKDRVTKDAMSIFANNVKGNNYIRVNTATHSLNNTHECTIVSQTDSGSIIQFKSDNTELVNTILVVYVTDLTAWTVIGENNVIYALMPTPEDASTEYEKQIVSTIIDQHSNGKELDVQLVYPSASAFDGKNNYAAYMITTDGTFNVGSNAKTYAFYKYDYIK